MLRIVQKSARSQEHQTRRDPSPPHMMSIVGSILQTGDHADLMIKSGGPALTVPTLHKRQTWRLRCKGSVSQVRGVMDVVATSGALPLSVAAVPLGSRTGPPDQPKRNLAFDSPVAERSEL